MLCCAPTTALRAGIVGSGMARAFLEAGATVIAPARSPASQARVQRLDALAPQGRLHVPLADHGSPEGAAEVAAYVKAHAPGGRVDHVVSIAGGERCLRRGV